MAWNTTAATWVANAVVTAAQLNAQLRDALNGIQAAWTSYTPAVTSSGTAPTLGTASSVTGTYQQIGKNIWGASEIVFGTSGFAAGTGTYSISLPVAATAAGVSGGRYVVNGVFFDASTSTWYLLAGLLSTSTTVRFAINASATLLGATAPVVPANNDQIRFSFMYEAA